MPTATIAQLFPANTIGLSGTPLDQFSQAATIDGHQQIALYSSSSFVWGTYSASGIPGQYILSPGDIVVGGSNIQYDTILGHFAPKSGTITSVQIAMPAAFYYGGLASPPLLQITGLSLDIATNLSAIFQAFASGDTSGLEAILDTYNYHYAGSGGDDQFVGGGQADQIDGGAGADYMAGKAGDDFYAVDNIGDVVDEGISGSGGYDTVDATVSIDLANTAQFKGQIENLRLQGSADLTIRGNSSANSLIGNSGANVLDGRAGADYMAGNTGNDTYYVDNALDTVSEAAGAGSDRVLTSVSYTLAAGQEIETLTTTYTAGTAAINLTGNTFAQTIGGNAGANIINGGGGADLMQGFGGNDTYYVDNTGDRVIEAANGGSDRVLTSVSYALTAGAQVETLTTTNTAGTGALNLTGNEFAQTIGGNAGANIIDGKGGADTMQGFGGNDTYYVDNALDRVIEAVGGGTDRVLASVNYTLAAGVQVETFTTTATAGTGALNLTGNEFAQVIGGNNGANVIDGKGGADTMQGFGGNDTYYVDNALDRVIEAVGGGTDRVMTSVNYTLTAGAQVETLTTTNTAGTGAINLTGNEFNQTIGGNNGANVIDGKTGNDILTGFGGHDTFVFSTALKPGNVDSITDFSIVDDTIQLAHAIFTGLTANHILDASAFHIGSAAGDASDRIIYNSMTGNLYFDDDGLGGQNQQQFAHLSAGLAMTNADFFVA